MPNTILKSASGKPYVAVDDNGTKKLVVVNGEYIALDPTPFKGDKGEQGIQGIQGIKGEGLNWLTDNYSDLTDFENNGKDFEIVKFNLNKDGSNNAEGIVMLAKVGSEVKEFRTWEETKQYVDSQILLAQADIDVVEEDLDKLTEKVDANTTDVNDLAAQVQSIENTWKGSQGFGGTNPAEPEIDLKTLTGDKGAFDFTAGKKMLVKITLNNTLYSAEQLMRVGDHSSFHISGRKLDGGETTDVTFTLSLNTNGTLKMTDFHSTGTANQNAFFLRLELVEQNPKVVAVIDAYTKAESDAKYEPRDYDFSDIESPLTYNLTSGKRYQIITKPSGADATPVGATNKIVLKVTTTDATQLPQDADQITYGTDLVWIVKANGDIMTWGEIKDNVAAKKIMVIKHLSNGNWELVKWEDKPVEKADKTSVYTKTESDTKYSTKTETDAKLSTLAKVKNTGGTVVELKTMTGQVSDTDTTADTDKMLITQKYVDDKSKAALDRIIDGTDITPAGAKAIVDKSGLDTSKFLGDFTVLVSDTEAQIITKLDAQFTTANTSDYVEIIQPTTTAGEEKYFLMTKTDTSWNKGTERTVHIKGGGSGSDVIIYKKGQIVPFPIGYTPQPSTLWEDAGIKAGYTLVSGSTPGDTIGENLAHKHIDGVGTYQLGKFAGQYGYIAGQNNGSWEGGDDSNAHPYTSTEGGPANLAAGHKVKFWKAKEDITVSASISISAAAVYANKNLSNVNVGTANAGKLFQVKADGTIEYVDKPTIYQSEYVYLKNKDVGTYQLNVPAGFKAYRIVNISITNRGLMNQHFHIYESNEIASMVDSADNGFFVKGQLHTNNNSITITQGGRFNYQANVAIEIRKEI